ncbi:MAG: bifunctional phosphoribosylaminoimidazolecarboxamide formyltransferase/IMP cyclohydrolase [Pseudomonadota bacterium]
MLIPVRRALLSVSDKTGLEPLARALVQRGVELISTGGTRAALTEMGLKTLEISEVTGKPEAFGGRMKTLSFEVCSALLFHRERDADEARALNIAPIDLVVVNLYPFEKKRDQGVDDETLVENIDIGGPTLIRAAAKNHRFVTVLTDPAQYPAVIEELAAHDGALSLETRTRLARQAYNRTADYDAAIAVELDRRAAQPSLRLAFDGGQVLRYGENSHQQATLYRQRGASTSLCDMKILGGKPLSFNNLVDLQGALDAVRDLGRPGVAIIKHTNPCGLAVADSLRAAFEAAWAGDPVSAFGSVIAFNRPLDVETARFLNLDAEPKSARKFVEIVAAPVFSDEAVAYLQQHKDLRIVELDPAQAALKRDVRVLPGAALEQDPDVELLAKQDVVTQAQPPALDDDLLRFGLVATRQVKSNAIVLVRRRGDGVVQLLGMGAGQPNRLNSVKLAVARARENLAAEYQGGSSGLEAHIAAQLGLAVLVSDAFFPFPDGVEAAAAAGVRCVFQPGGSIRDKAVIKKCDELGVAMVFTGLRHFRH